MNTGWSEVADRVFQRRYDPCDVTVVAVLGADGLAVVDTRCSPAEARELRDDLRRLGDRPVRWVVNTHAHYDHCWGNAEFVAPRQVPPAQLWGHRAAVAAMAAPAEIELAPPDRLVDSSAVLDLGDRALELHYAGRGHTDGDLYLYLPDAEALLAGDLVEESGPPALGDDSYPLDWPDTLDRVLAAAGPATTVVPGHGAPVTPAFARAQSATLRELATALTAAHANGVPWEAASRDCAVDPWTPEVLADAAHRAYQQLNGALPRA